MKNIYQIKTLTWEGRLESNGHLPLESDFYLPPLPEEAEKNIVADLKYAAKINLEHQEIYVLVDKDMRIVAFNSNLFELLMPFGM